jgi:hypothetical protein
MEVEAEILRSAAKNIAMEEAARLIALVQAPVGLLVEDLGGVRLVLVPDVSVSTEILLLLHSHYPSPMHKQDTSGFINQELLAPQEKARPNWFSSARRNDEPATRADHQADR